MLRVLIFVVSLGARALRAMGRRRADLVIENLALKQQVTALKKERPAHGSTTSTELSGSHFDDRGLGGRVACSSSTRIQYPGGSGSVQTILGEDFRTPASGTASRRRRNPSPHPADGLQDGWRAPRIHAELTKLSFIISEKTVSRYMPRLPAEPDEVKDQ